MEINEAEGRCPDCGVIVELVGRRDGEYYQCPGCGWEGTEVPVGKKPERYFREDRDDEWRERVEREDRMNRGW